MSRPPTMAMTIPAIATAAGGGVADKSVAY
jgi:hypothetical protein